MLIGTHEAVILSAIIDTIGGVILYSRDPVKDSRSFWMPLSVAMIAGSIAGGILLKVVPAESFDLLLAVVITVLGGWFVTGRGKDGESSLEQHLPDTCARSDMAVSAFAGLCGGLFAVSGPPIVYWLGRRFAKYSFRRALIAVFFFATIFRLLTYGAVGLLSVRIWIPALFTIPGILLGILLGNRIFIALSERAFSRVIGSVLLVVGVRLLFK